MGLAVGSSVWRVFRPEHAEYRQIVRNGDYTARWMAKFWGISGELSPLRNRKLTSIKKSSAPDMFLASSHRARSGAPS